jgi:uncharacterized protein YjeT (DUF2065 family)
MERSIEVFAAINFLIIGVSHLTQPAAWKSFFALLASKGEAGAFVNGFITLSMGSLIVAFHNVWTGIPTVLTVLGWLYVLKSLIIFVVPGAGLKSLRMAASKNTRLFVAPGVMLIVVGLLLLYAVFAE